MHCIWGEGGGGGGGLSQSAFLNLFGRSLINFIFTNIKYGIMIVQFTCKYYIINEYDNHLK